MVIDESKSYGVPRDTIAIIVYSTWCRIVLIVSEGSQECCRGREP